ncbi:hypothetical protein HCN44_007824 [Aphidius gifuensis]|uniref:Uncharacterized protein n=1 Tax=Aphidius gifuensis TaxID=684658 RepID=A0A834XPF9_APHGI|nr:hypothetical protein HCN44_007824 [Aphidius gifuensis]
MWSIILWQNGTTSIEPSNGVRVVGNKTKIIWSHNNKAYDGRVLMQHDDREFLSSYDVNRNGSLTRSQTQPLIESKPAPLSKKHVLPQTLREVIAASSVLRGVEIKLLENIFFQCIESLPQMVGKLLKLIIGDTKLRNMTGYGVGQKGKYIIPLRPYKAILSWFCKLN